MTRLNINIGTKANDATGDPLRLAFDKVNQNFIELYAKSGGASVTAGATPPNTPDIGNLWYDSIGGRMYVYYDHGWIDSSPVPNTVVDSLVNGSYSVLLGSDGKVTLPDSLTIANSIVGKSSSVTQTQQSPGGIVSLTNTEESQVEIATTSVVVARRSTQISDDGITTATDIAGTQLDIANTYASLKLYQDPSGPNNTVYRQFIASNAGTVVEAVQETVGGPVAGRVTVAETFVKVFVGDGVNDNTWQFSNDGTLNLPLATDNSAYLQSTSHIKLNANSKVWTFDNTGRLTLPIGGTIVDSNGTNILNGLGGGATDRITVGGKTLSIDTNGVLAFPNNNTLDTGGPAFKIQSQNSITISPNAHNFVFGSDGTLTVPGETTLGTTHLNGENYLNNGSPLIWFNIGTVARIDYNSNLNLSTGDSIKLQAGWTKNWTFDGSGNLTLPAGGLIKNSDGSTYGGTSTGDITFSGNEIRSVNSHVKLVANSDSQNRRVLQVYTDGTVEIPVGVSGSGVITSASNVWLSANGKQLQLSSGGAVDFPLVNGTTALLRTSGNLTLNSNGKEWLFGSNGTLTMPGIENNTTAVIDFFAGATNNHRVILTNDWTLKLQARASGGNEGHLYLTAGGAGTRVQVNGSGSTVQICATDGSQVAWWEFDKTGKITFPDNTVQSTAYQTTTAPGSSKGISGNKAGMVAFDGNYFYYCKQDYTDGVADIWVRSAWTNSSW